MHKLSYKVNEEWKEYSHPAVYKYEMTKAGVSRLIAGLPSQEINILAQILRCLDEPLFLLYVLHTPRGEGDPGRYQSPELNKDEIQQFLSRFSAFLLGDARYDVWLHSPTINATIAWDRHNLIYAYGPTECMEAVLVQSGFTNGNPLVPAPHAHHYRPEFDSDARAILTHFEWKYSELRPEDEQ
jgi:hypothetical protein